MRTPIAILVFVCILLLIIAFSTMTVKGEDRKAVLMISLMCFPIFGGIGAILINGGSNKVTVINGINRSECITKKYFLMYNSHLAAKESIVFMAPWGKDLVFNNTNETLVCYPIEYGNVKKNEQPMDIPAHSIRKISEKPTYFFEPIPDKIMYSSRYTSSGRIKWAVYTKEQEIVYKEAYKWMDSYSK